MAKPNAEMTFRAKAPAVMAQLITDFSISPIDAAAILGNIGHECAGFTALQEIKPVVAGSKGGYGWVQWTGPRRRAYEAYCARTGKDPASDEANYAYLFIELKGIEGSEKAAIGKLKAAQGLEAKVIAFEKAFLRAGVKHYPSRLQWANIALDAWRSHGKTGIPIPNPTPIPTVPLPDPKPGGANPTIIAAIILATLTVAFFLITQVRF